MLLCGSLCAVDQSFIQCSGLYTYLNTPCAVQVTFHDPVRYGLKKELFIAAEGMYSGQVRRQRLHRTIVQVVGAVLRL